MLISPQVPLWQGCFGGVGHLTMPIPDHVVGNSSLLFLPTVQPGWLCWRCRDSLRDPGHPPRPGQVSHPPWLGQLGKDHFASAVCTLGLRSPETSTHGLLLQASNAMHTTARILISIFGSYQDLFFIPPGKIVTLDSLPSIFAARVNESQY